MAYLECELPQNFRNPQFKRRRKMLKRITVVSMLLVFAFLAAAPEAFADCRNRRGSYRTAYYGSPYRYRSSGYNSYRYRSSGYSPYRYSSYGYNSYGYGNSYGYSPYRYRSVAGQRYYGRRSHSTRNLILSIAAPGAVGAGVGALLGGKKGAGVGALLGAGGGAAYYLIRNRHRRY